MTRNVSRRLARLEAARGFTVSAEDLRTLQIAEIIWERRRRRLEAEGKAYDRPPFNPTHGPFKMLSLEETLHKRRQERVDRRQREQETGANGT